MLVKHLICNNPILPFESVLACNCYSKLEYCVPEQRCNIKFEIGKAYMTQSPKKTISFPTQTGFLAITYNLSAMLSPGGLPCVADKHG